MPSMIKSSPVFTNVGQQDQYYSECFFRGKGKIHSHRYNVVYSSYFYFEILCVYNKPYMYTLKKKILP